MRAAGCGVVAARLVTQRLRHRPLRAPLPSRSGSADRISKRKATMLRTVVEARALVAMMVAACVGTWGLRQYPVDHENLFLALIAAKDPGIFHVLTYGYATMWFSTPFFAASIRSEEHTSELQSLR